MAFSPIHPYCSPGGGAWMKIKSPPPVLILELLEHILAKFTPLFLGTCTIWH